MHKKVIGQLNSLRESKEDRGGGRGSYRDLDVSGKTGTPDRQTLNEGSPESKEQQSSDVDAARKVI